MLAWYAPALPELPPLKGENGDAAECPPGPLLLLMLPPERSPELLPPPE